MSLCISYANCTSFMKHQINNARARCVCRIKIPSHFQFGEFTLHFQQYADGLSKTFTGDTRASRDSKAFCLLHIYRGLCVGGKNYTNKCITHFQKEICINGVIKFMFSNAMNHASCIYVGVVWRSVAVAQIVIAFSCLFLYECQKNGDTLQVYDCCHM